MTGSQPEHEANRRPPNSAEKAAPEQNWPTPTPELTPEQAQAAPGTELPGGGYHPLVPKLAEQAPDDSMGTAQSVSLITSMPQFIVVITVNLLVLAELCISVYMATKEPEEFTVVFFKVFFSLLIPTLIASSIAKRFVRAWEKKQ